MFDVQLIIFSFVCSVVMAMAPLVVEYCGHMITTPFADGGREMQLKGLEKPSKWNLN